MRRFDERDEVDVVVVGCGAGGATLIQRLARTGIDRRARRRPLLGPRHRLGQRRARVAPPVLDRATGDQRNRSRTARLQQLGAWRRRLDGPLRRLHPRFHPSDFTRSRDGVGADWPIGYDDLRAVLQAIEEELPVSGQPWPWGDPHRYPYSPQPVGGNGNVFLRAPARWASKPGVGPVAIANGRFGNRPHCIYRGFCLQGCKVNAKASPFITHVPDALAHGAEVGPTAWSPGSSVTHGRATGVTYLGEGVERFPAARLVVVAGYSIETPRLLLLSACDRGSPTALCNSHGQVGRYVMVQGAPQVAGRFDDEVRMYKAPPPEVEPEQFYETDPTKPYQRGYSIQNVSPLPITYAEHVAAQGHWGDDLREYMRDYIHWATLGALCEFLPGKTTRVTLRRRPTATAYRSPTSPTPSATTTAPSWPAARESTKTILRAAGATETITIERYAHLVGGCRMAADDTGRGRREPADLRRRPTCTSPTAASCRPRDPPTRP